MQNNHDFQVQTAFIGGTGLYAIDGLETIGSYFPDTPWGKPSDEITIARYRENGKTIQIAFLPRHGRGHYLLPTEVPQRANMAALKLLGTERIIAFSSVGSLREEMAPTHFVLPSQIIDRTRNRGPEETFFGDGVVAHISFGDPFCAPLAALLEKYLQKIGVPCHRDATLICMEGPAFSTRAESNMYRAWGGDIINMSVLPEAKLARELEISYQMVAMSTDYDSWRVHAEAVTTSDVMQTVQTNGENATKLIRSLLPELTEAYVSPLKGSLKFAILTAVEKRPQQIKENLNLLLPCYF